LLFGGVGAMRVRDSSLVRRAAWCAAVCVAVWFLGARFSWANPKPLPGHLWSWGPLGNVFFDLVFDFAILALVGWAIGPFRRGFDRRFIWWGLAIWVCGLFADALAWMGFPLRYSEGGTVIIAITLIFVFNSFLAAAWARMGWNRNLALAAAIAVLTAPYFDQPLPVKQRSRQASCIAHLKQIVTAARMYADDHDGMFPDVGTYSHGFFGEWTEGADWSAPGGPLAEYLKASDEIFRCPSARDRARPSYSWNRHLSRVREADVEYPTSTPLVWDGVPGVRTAAGIPLQHSSDGKWVFSPTGGKPSQQQTEAATRHYGGLIMGFADGHVRFERPMRWAPQNVGGRFMECDDTARPWPPKEYRGILISMYPKDPMDGNR
jgi:prepilin-type processing-associated H-X9-DG protein